MRESNWEKGESERKGFCDFAEKAVQREAVDVAERKWLQCEGGNEE